MLKEEDPMIELIREWIIKPLDVSAGLHLSVLEVFGVFDRMVSDHVLDPENSTLKRMLPDIKRVFVPIDLTRAAKEYDASRHFLARKRVPPTFKEIRHVLNLATLNAIAGDLKLVTFDADDTIYEDGGNISRASPMVHVIVGLLVRGIIVSLVTAAGYPGEPNRYEERLRGILEALEDLTPAQRARFLVMGGECNYLLETYRHGESGKVGLREIDGKHWKVWRGERWPDSDVSALLDAAERVLQDMTDVLHLPTRILRKERAIGIINLSHKRLSYENLEEICLTLQHELQGFSVPFCAFNGGNDVWVDIGNKALGIQALQKYVFRFLPKEMQGEELSIIQATECLHVGDRFTRTGNDTRSREAATTVWVSDPQETAYVMKKLLKKIDAARGADAAAAAELLSRRKANHEEREAQIEAAIQAATSVTRTS